MFGKKKKEKDTMEKDMKNSVSSSVSNCSNCCKGSKESYCAKGSTSRKGK